METRAFKARTMEEALRKTRRELGPEALIVSAKRAGVSGSLFEVLALGNPEQARPPLSESSPAGQAEAAALDLEGSLIPLREDLAGLRRMIQDLRNVTEQSVLPGFSYLKNLIVDSGQVSESSRLLGPLYVDLIEQGLEAEHAKNLVRAVEMELGLKDGDHRDLMTIARGLLKQLLQTQVAVSGPIVPERDKRTFLFLGASGVGKTTTIAKLASRMTLSEGLNVSIVTTDTCRVGSVEQIRRYAEIIGAPLVVAGKGAILSNAIRTHSSADVVLIDTAGRSFENEQVRDQLLEAISDIQGNVESHLLMSAASSPQQQRAIFKRFSGFEPQRVIVTKVDETSMAGGVLNAHKITDLPISYLTTGQRVPEDIEVARCSRIIDLLMTKAN